MSYGCSCTSDYLVQISEGRNSRPAGLHRLKWVTSHTIGCAPAVGGSRDTDLKLILRKRPRNRVKRRGSCWHPENWQLEDHLPSESSWLAAWRRQHGITSVHLAALLTPWQVVVQLATMETVLHRQHFRPILPLAPPTFPLAPPTLQLASGYLQQTGWKRSKTQFKHPITELQKNSFAHKWAKLSHLMNWFAHWNTYWWAKGIKIAPNGSKVTELLHSQYHISNHYV